MLKSPFESVVHLPASDRVFSRTCRLDDSAASRRGREASAQDCLETARQLSTNRARGLPYNLLAVIGFPYMLLQNLDTADGLVNGAVGTLQWMQPGQLRGTSVAAQQGVDPVQIERLWMRFPGNAGRQRSRRNRGVLESVVERSEALRYMMDPYHPPPTPTVEELEGAVPIDREDVDLGIGGRYRTVMRQQFPLVPALAFTIHKSQGDSREAVCVEYKPEFSNELVYVSLSRVTKLSGLYIDSHGVRPNSRGHLFQHPPSLDEAEDVGLSPVVKRQRERQRGHLRVLQEEKARLRSVALVPRWQPVLDMMASGYHARILYHNVQSLARHREDIMCDEVFMGADILLLVETWLKPGDDVSLVQDQNAPFGQFELVARCDRTSGQGGGVAIYSKWGGRALPTPHHPDIEMAAAVIEGKFYVAAMYCHSKTVDSQTVVAKVRELLPPTEPGHCVLAGDFNMDMMPGASLEGLKLQQGMADYGLGLANAINESTTYDSAGTVIDGVFVTDIPEVKNPHMRAGRYQSYFSHHVPLICFIPLAPPDDSYNLAAIKAVIEE